MRIEKTEKSAEGNMGVLRAKLPGVAELQVDERGKLTARVTGWAADGQGSSVEHQVMLTDGDIERLLTCLANPKSPEISALVSKLMSENLRNTLRLSALGSGVLLTD
ncbi:hypothetical protein [Pollutimonas thiosulfatoxidans]|uniref:Uncharacterized protein n=1 Tax=Pollutimonas thiosulfatoxidans TaxID=2028345 RepID=A0A410GC53_9BURK|nr:hypothetical protein [Pollutimonas thiosulfatoxidans]MBF6617129.1 hypothetical protein [Candidimonas sp.]NYT44543.1 hypothetical protein [Alcaligenaceae bacterium]QAA93871.1 hypothetical protein CKA81_08485 [Pollutimonas thiosulfatoxidans]